MKINQVLNEYEYSPQEESKAYDQYLIIKRENPLYAEAFWSMWRRTGNVQAALQLADKEYDRITSESIEEDDDFVYASDLLYFDKDGKEIGYMDFDGYDNANSGHSEQELQAIAQKFNISPKDGKVVGYFDASDDEVDFSDDSNDETYPEGSIGVYIDSHSKEESIEEAVYSVIVNGQEQRYRDIRGADVRIWKHIQGLEQKNNKGSLSKSPHGKVDPSKIILKRNGVEVPHKYTGKEKQPITGPLVGNSYPSDKLSEAMSDAYGIVSAEPEVEGSVEFKQHKNTDKGSVSIEASGDNMQELAKVLKLAGLTLPQDMYKDEPQASADDHEPEQEDVLLSPDHEDDKEESPCDSADTDVSYETDKEILINYIKDKLKKSIS